MNAGNAVFGEWMKNKKVHKFNLQIIAYSFYYLKLLHGPYLNLVCYLDLFI